jgi:hypothetical protein
VASVTNRQVQGTVTRIPSRMSIMENSVFSLVAQACNPSYSGCRDQEDGSSKPAQANSW